MEAKEILNQIKANVLQNMDHLTANDTFSLINDLIKLKCKEQREICAHKV